MAKGHSWPALRTREGVDVPPLQTILLPKFRVVRPIVRGEYPGEGLEKVLEEVAQQWPDRKCNLLPEDERLIALSSLSRQGTEKGWGSRDEVEAHVLGALPKSARSRITAAVSGLSLRSVVDVIDGKRVNQAIVSLRLRDSHRYAGPLDKEAEACTGKKLKIYGIASAALEGAVGLDMWFDAVAISGTLPSNASAVVDALADRLRGVDIEFGPAQVAWEKPGAAV